MPSRVGSLQWLKENDPAAYRDHRNKKQREHRAANPQHHKNLAKLYREKNKEATREHFSRWWHANKGRFLEAKRAYAKSYRSKNPDKVLAWRANNYIVCPACEGLASKDYRDGGTVMCKECYLLVRRMNQGKEMPNKETMKLWLDTILKGEKGQWQKLIIHRKATRSRKRALKQLSQTLQSQTSEKSGKRSKSSRNA